MAIYGNYILNEETILINETYFTKKDLQDPKTVEKILKQTKKYKSVTDFLIALTAIVAFLGSVLSLGILLFPLILLFTKIYEVLNALPSKSEDKKLLKLKNECIKLKEKTLKQMEKDTKNNSKYKELISNLDKTIATIDKKYQDELDKKYKEECNEVKKIYNRLYDYLNKEAFGLGDGYDNDIFLLARSAKIPESELIKAIKKSSKLDGQLLDWWGGNEDEAKEDCREFIGLGKEFSDPKLPIKVILTNDDFWLIYLPSNNKIIALYQGNKGAEALDTSIYKQLGNDNLFDRYNEDVIIDVDKELGYFVFSKCPDAVIPKKFIK